MNTKRACDREIGSPVKGWHVCGAKAMYGVERSSAQGYAHTLHFCSAHHNAAIADLNKVQCLRTTREYVL